MSPARSTGAVSGSRPAGRHRFPPAKLIAPALPPVFVRRARLFDLLDPSPGPPVTVVRAFPGSGASLTVADWVHAMQPVAGDNRGPRFAWVSCDEGDRNPHRLWAAVVAGIERAVGRSTTTSGGHDVASVVNDLLADAPSLVIVIDDAHRAGEGVEVLQPLLGRLPPGTRIAFTTSTRLPLRLERMDAVGDVSEIRQSALAFTQDEISELLALEEVVLDEDGVVELHHATEGWLTPINLVLGASQGLWPHERAEQLARLASRDPGVGLPLVVHRFITSEIRRAGGTEALDASLSIADLEPFTVADCRAVLGADGAAWIERLESAGLFVTEASDGERFRLHPTFARYLREEASAQPAEARRARHRRAARWFESSRSMTRAIRHHFAADDVHEGIETLAVALLDGNTVVGPSSVSRWVAEVDEAQVRASRSSRAFAVYALALTHLGDTAGARRWLIAAEHAGRTDPDPITPLLARLGIEVIEGRISEALDCYLRLDTTRRRLQEPPGVLASMAGMAAFLWSGDHAAALDVGERFLDSSPPPAHRALVTSASSAVLALEGRLGDAASTASDAIELATEHEVSGHWGMALAWLARAQVAYDRGHLDSAGHDVRHWIEHGAPLVPALSFAAHSVLADVVLTAGRVTAARRLATAAHTLPLDHRSPLWDQLTELDVRIALASREFGRARWLVQHIRSRWRRAITEARVALSAGEPSAADSLVSMLSEPESQRDRLTYLILQGRIRRQLGDEVGSDESLERALDLAIPEMAVTAFFEDGPELWQPLARIVQARSAHEFLAAGERMERVAVAARRHVDVPTASPTARGRIGSLRPRELQVLKLIGENLTNREIAATMGVSVNTLKTHIRKLYSRLAIDDRSAAVDLARHLVGADQGEQLDA